MDSRFRGNDVISAEFPWARGPGNAILSEDFMILRLTKRLRRTYLHGLAAHILTVLLISKTIYSITKSKTEPSR